MLKEFSKNNEYVIENIPNLNFFSKKLWLNEKIKEFQEKNAIFIIKDDKILWSVLEEDEKFWLPYEKGKFFLSCFEENFKEKIIAEQIGFQEYNYYCFFEDFMVCYTQSLTEAINSFSSYSNSKNIKILFSLNFSTVL